MFEKMFQEAEKSSEQNKNSVKDNESIHKIKISDQSLQSKKYEEARFMFERNIVFNPKDAKSYLYLAKIYNHKEDQRKEKYNLDISQIKDLCKKYLRNQESLN